MSEATSGERRLFGRVPGPTDKISVDIGFGPLTILDWSLGGARLAGAQLAFTVGDFVTGEIAAGSTKGAFIADVMRILPPHFDARRAPDEVSIRWLELPDDVIDAMLTLTENAPAAT